MTATETEMESEGEGIRMVSNYGGQCWSKLNQILKGAVVTMIGTASSHAQNSNQVLFHRKRKKEKKSNKGKKKKKEGKEEKKALYTEFGREVRKASLLGLKGVVFEEDIGEREAW